MLPMMSNYVFIHVSDYPFGDSKNDLIFKNHIKKVPFGTFLFCYFQSFCFSVFSKQCFTLLLSCFPAF